MNFKQFFIEKIVPNALIWFVAYIVLGKVVAAKFPELSVDWTELVDKRSLVVFLLGVVASIVIAWLVAKGAQLPWFLQKVREEASSAFVNFSSIALVVGVPELNLATVLLGAGGILVAWRTL